MIHLRSFKNYERKVSWKASDDREEASAGIKFNDADLIGISRQVVVSEKLAVEGKVEVRLRRDGASETVDLSALDKTLKS